MKPYALLATVAALLLSAPLVWASSDSTQNLPDETTEYQADLLQLPASRYELSAEDVTLQAQEMQGVSQDMNAKRPQPVRGRVSGLSLPDGLVIRGTRQGGVGIGVEF